MRSKDIGIIGYGSSVYEKGQSQPLFSYFAQAAKACIESAGVKKAEIDGLALSSFTTPPDNAVTVAEQLGLTLSWASVFTAGGAGAIATIMDAIRTVESGDTDLVLCVAGDARTMADFRRMISKLTRAIGDYAAPLGFGGMNGFFAMIQRKHMATYGTRREQLGRIAVDQRHNALLNEKAMFRTPLTLEDYLNARLIADPLRLYDCPMPVSGADAILVGALDRVPAGKGVRMLSGFQCHNHPPHEISPLRGGWETFRGKLYDEAGCGPADMDFVQPYDDYPIMVAIQLEDLGFCKKGEVGAFLEANRFTYDGTFPLNTGGGQLSCAATGGGAGMISVIEAVTQLRREAGSRQVKDATRGLVSGYGMVSYGHGLSASSMILERT